MRAQLCLFVSLFGLTAFATSQSTIDAQIRSWKNEGKRKGWTFKVKDNPVMHAPEKLLHGYNPQVNFAELAELPEITPTEMRIPAKWDWREQGAVSPIKDQAFPQYCGSCWAFGTVAVFESLIKIVTGQDVDISEQQLVSCQPSYGSCNGGNFAFGFYSQKGAIHENDFPYKAKNASCNDQAEQHEKIFSYAHVGSRSRGATVEEMKQAIYQYGPIAVTVSASGAWNGYTSGVYNECNSRFVNHIVALVGYDDDEQAWILKNSHGTQWGEAGYMRIKYVGKNGKKCNNVGQDAMFAQYKP